MVVGGSRQETLDPGVVLLGPRQQEYLLLETKEKRNTEEHITSGNGDRNEKDEQELDRTRKEGPGMSGLENAGQWPIVHGK
ncbi:unnamed protein product [Schistosoma mattheei]|uniref:Uncharacterized protein n=1 Tax=Schistosoma mattheei TaxID=31246 RepID=A0A183NMU2_9TREM|nr:unnamed protein product [Schistosoma mattheei]